MRAGGKERKDLRARSEAGLAEFQLCGWGWGAGEGEVTRSDPIDGGVMLPSIRRKQFD